jgi:ArsR family transcriptional regulator
MRYTLNKERVDETIAFFTHITNEKEDCICRKVKSCKADKCESSGKPKEDL